MRAMVLAAGRGKRLAPLTDELPKPLVPLAGIPLIDRVLLRLAAAGVTEVVINVCWLAEKIVSHVGSGARFGLSVTFSREYGEALETGGGICQALPWLGGDPFWVVNADVYTDFLFPWSATSLSHRDDARLLLVPNPAHNIQGDFRLAGSQVLPIDAEDGEPLTYAGIGLFRPQFFADRAVERASLAPWLINSASRGRLQGTQYLGEWDDIGTPERLAIRERMIEAAER